MYKIYFYKAKDGSQPVADYIRGLASKADKDSRIKLNKIQDYINALSEYGVNSKASYFVTYFLYNQAPVVYGAFFMPIFCLFRIADGKEQELRFVVRDPR